MNTNNMTLRAAVAFALSVAPLFAAQATAVYGPGKPLTLASEYATNPGDKVMLAAAGTPPATDTSILLDLPAFSGRVINSNTTPLEIRIRLTGGATFTGGLSAGSLQCTYTAGAVGPTYQNVLSIQDGNNGETSVNFKLSDGTYAAGGKCVFSGVVALHSGQKDYGMVVSAQFKNLSDSTENVASNLEGTVITFAQSYALTVSPVNVMINVASPHFSQKFGNGGTVTAVLGNFSYGTTRTDIYFADNAANGLVKPVVGTNLLTNTIKVTLSGAPLLAGGRVIRSFIGTTVADCDTTVGLISKEIKTVSVSGVVTFETIPAADFVSSTFCYVVDGSTRVDKGNVTFDVSYTPSGTANGNLTVAGDKTLATFAKNGTSIKVLNIPNPTNTAEVFNIRIYNMGSSDAGVYGTLYEMDKGNVAGPKLIGKNVLLATVPANAMKGTTSAGLAKLMGVTDWVGRAWMQIEGDSQQIRVQALMYSGNNKDSLVNMGDRVLEDSGAFCRSDTTCR